MPHKPNDPDLDALRRANRVAPERPATEAITLRRGADLSLDHPGDEPSDGSADGAAADLPSDDLETDRDPDSGEDATLEDWAVADASRPDLDDETDDGLSDLEEEVRRQAEDPVSISPGRRR